MEQNQKTRERLIQHYRQYPALQIQDIFKYLHQSAFGCEHMVSSQEKAIEGIRKESSLLSTGPSSLIDALDGTYSRVHLACLHSGTDAETLGKFFFLSAVKDFNGIFHLEKKLSVAKELVYENILPFSPDAFEKAVLEWKSHGYPAVHHSDVFRRTYHPSYRVIANQYLPFLF